ncbi:MAG TPA: serine/threonine-protein kinase [Polyangiaceae bacterium]|nr:serine/threonine-protein kinase [Polyangiaceae bacterium]
MLEVGQVVDGKYRVERLLGKGGMGAVFEGHHLHIGRRVAIKVLLPEVTASEEGVARFEREVRAAGRIGSDHILEVYDVGALPDGARFMVSEFLDGETLSGRLERGALSPRDTTLLMLQLLDGLGAAHHAGIVHRDLKPDNIFLLARRGGQSDFVKIIDFGVSKYQFEDPTSMSMTTTGAVIGTPYYLSPEQARGQRDIDARSDLYTVGVIIYQCVAGQVPIRAETFNELLFKIALQTAPPLTTDVPSIDPKFSALVEKAMSREREGRFQTAAELRQALENWLSGVSINSQQAQSLPRGWNSDTVASPMPTSSTFGRTQSPTSPFAPRRTPKVLLVAGAIVLMASIGLAARLLRAPSAPATAGTGSAASAPPSAATVAPAPEVAPIPLPPTPPSDTVVTLPTGEPPPAAAPDPTLRPPALPPATRRFSSAASRSSRSAPASTAVTAPPAVAPPPPPPVAEPETSTGRKRRDFGY